MGNILFFCINTTRGKRSLLRHLTMPLLCRNDYSMFNPSFKEWVRNCKLLKQEVRIETSKVISNKRNNVIQLRQLVINSCYNKILETIIQKKLLIRRN